MVLVQNLPFSNFFFIRQYRPGKCVLWYWRTKKKNTFEAIKNRKLKKWKNFLFSKGVSASFWSKICHFSTFFFIRQYRPGKCVLWYWRTKKKNTFEAIKNRKLKKWKNFLFSKGVSASFWSKMCHFSTFVFR